MTARLSTSNPSNTRFVAAALAVLAVGWAVVTYYLLTTPQPPGSGLGSGEGGPPQWILPAIGHFGLFGDLSAILFAPVFSTTPLTRHPYISAAVVASIAAAYGGGLELYQITLPERYASWLDGLTNFTGAVAGVLVILMATRMGGFRDRITRSRIQGES